MFTLVPIPAFTDNYLWCLHDGQRAIVVDPGDAAPVQAFLQAHQLTLSGVLVTHHHADHVGGVAQLVGDQNIPVYGPAFEAISCVTHPLAEADVLTLLGIDFSVLEVPGHTRGHIAYTAQVTCVVHTINSAPLYSNATRSLLFCGDTLFAAGCGRLFEGSPAQMYRSLQKLTALPTDSLVCCAHEYTLSNLKFAVAVEPNNAALRARVTSDQAKRRDHLPTVPSSIATELATNPFLRTHVDEVAQSASINAEGPIDTQDGVAVFAALRSWKNRF
jgi:hydroxyacylglutathione hydrolase